MAKKTAKKRKRRSDEELIHDLQDKLRDVKERQAAKEAMRSPSMKAAVRALVALDRALEVAAEESDTPLRHSLADSRRPLADGLEKRGFKAPKANLPRGRRPKNE